MAILNGEGKNKDIVIEKNKLHFLKNYYLPVTFTKITNIPLSRYGITVSSAWEKLVMSIRITMELLFSGTVKIQYTSYGRK